jgi:hypothetical protein
MEVKTYFMVNSYSNKATLLLWWSHRYQNSTVFITIWLTVTKYPYLKWQWIFYYLRRWCFLIPPECDICMEGLFSKISYGIGTRRLCALNLIFIVHENKLSWFMRVCDSVSDMLLSHRYQNSTVFITIWLTVTKYPYLKWQWIFYYLRRWCFLSSITAKSFTRLDRIYE